MKATVRVHQTNSHAAATPWQASAQGDVRLQRKCACGTHAPNGGECESCAAKKVQRKSNGGVATPALPGIVSNALSAPGHPLDGTTRQFMETRFGHDFSGVRVHSDALAAMSTRAIDAHAYTAGRDVVFADGQYAPHTTSGRRLLAHELAHVVQQRHMSSAPDSIGDADSALERDADRAADQVMSGADTPRLLSASRPTLSRQPSPQPPAASPPGAGTSTFSVDQRHYDAQVIRAIDGISGAIVESNTAAAQVRPVLQAMSGQVVWRDDAGMDHGGGAASYTWPFGTMPTLRLRLVLDDQASPPDAGRFEPGGSNDATIFLRVRNNADEAAIQLTLYHESMHLLRWANNLATATPAASHGRAPATAGPAPTSATARALAHGSAPALANTVGLWLGQLKDSVNTRRAAGDQLTDADVHSVTDWLIEEVQVRAETEIFRLASSAQAARASHGPSVIVDTAQNIDVNQAMVDRYLFEFSGHFRTADRASLTPDDRQTIGTLASILDGFFQHQVRRRISVTAYTQRVPRAPIDYTPPPLVPPTFRPLPLPP